MPNPLFQPTPTNNINTNKIYKFSYRSIKPAILVVLNTDITPEEVWQTAAKNKEVYIEKEEIVINKKTKKAYKKVLVYWTWNFRGYLQRNQLEIRQDSRRLIIEIIGLINRNEIEFVRYRRKVGIRDKEKGITTTIKEYPKILDFPPSYWNPIKIMISRLEGEVKCEKDV